jgi:para-nitrobenzyl esterase
LQPDPVVETKHGKVRGIALENACAFLGIRYARADRFEAPVAPEQAAGIVDATSFGPTAEQRDPNPQPAGFGIILEKLHGGGAPPPALESENCQVLNVWSSNLSPEKLKPVMVWLHPGFFMVGSGASGNGAHIAARGDAVVVSLNHRLNVFGYTHLDDINSSFRQSGNVGMLDIVAALEWVRDNIDRFGGDPRRVMVFGSSGGGMKTAWLMSSPRSGHLLHRAGAQSGPCLKLMERDEASSITEQLLAELNLRPAQANELRKLPVERLLGAYHRLRGRNRPRSFTHLASFAPVIDAELMPRHPFHPDASPQVANIPMLIGWNRQDMSFFPGDDLGLFDLDERTLGERLEPNLGDRTAQIVAWYRENDRTATPGDLYFRIYSDWSIGGAVLMQAQRKAALAGAPTYVYRFDYPSPAYHGKLGAVHSSETSCVFGTQGPFSSGHPTAVQLSRTMQNAWVHFAATGNVNATANDLGDWPSFDASGAIMTLNSQPQTVADPIPYSAEWATLNRTEQKWL